MKIPNGPGLLWKMETAGPDELVGLLRILFPWAEGLTPTEPGWVVDEEGRAFYWPTMVKEASSIPVIEGARSPAEWLIGMREHVLAGWKATNPESAISHEYDETVSIPGAPWMPLYAAFQLGRLFQEQKHAPNPVKLVKKEVI